MRLFALLFAALWLATPAVAQPTGLPDPEAVRPITRPGLPLLPSKCDNAEQWERMFEQINVRNVTCPTLAPVIPKPGNANGKAVIVVPGGGYQFVSIDSEGFRVADALAARGYMAFVLKYRTVATPRETGPYMAAMAKLFGSLGKGELADNPPAVADLAAALSLVRSDAVKWNIDPAKVGVVGFSAGARTAIRLLEANDEARHAENVALIYPPMTQIVKGGPRPPLFLAISTDDPLFKQGGLALLQGWLGESRAAEFHLYSAGSHGFGMGIKGTTSDLWIEQYIAWLDRH